MASTSPHILSLLHRALESPHGIAVSVEEDVEVVIRHLKYERKKAMDEKLSILSFSPSPKKKGEVWIVKRSVLPIEVE